MLDAASTKCRITSGRRRELPEIGEDSVELLCVRSLVRSGLARLKDAENAANSLESRFDLAYGAAHALCLAALRHHGFRPSKRYIVFQVPPDTLGLGPDVWRVLSKCHDMRNRTEYGGALDVDERLITDLIGACRQVAAKVRDLPPILQKSK